MPKATTTHATAGPSSYDGAPVQPKKKCGAPRAFLYLIRDYFKTAGTGVEFCCERYCGIKINNHLLRETLEKAKLADLKRELTWNEHNNLIPTFQKSCQNYFEPVEECVFGACSKKKGAEKFGFELVNTIYKFETPYNPLDEQAFFSMPIRSPAERKRRRRPGTAGAAKPAKQSKKRRVDDAVVSTSGVVATTAAATITAAPAVPAALAPAPTFTAPTLAPSFATTFLPSFTPSFIPSFTPSFAPAPVPAPPVPKKNVMDISQLLSEDDSSPTSASAPLPVATKTAGLSSALDAIITPPTLPTPSSKSYPTPSDQEDGNLVVFMPYADEPDVPLFEVGVTGFGHRPEQSATWNTSSLDNEMTHVRIFSKVGLMPNPQKPKHQAWRM